MNKFQLKRLIREVIQEVEAGEPSAHDNHEDDKESNFTHPLAIKHGSSSPVLSLKLGGVNKNNSQKLKDFIGMVAHEAGKNQLAIIHAELESQGKLGFDMDAGEIKKSEAEINAELDAIAAGMAGEKESPEARLAKIKPGERAPEWQQATEKDAETQRANAKKRASMEKSGTLETDPKTGLPLDTDLWTDKDWELWDTGQKSVGNQSYRKASSVKGLKGAVPANMTTSMGR